MRIFRLAIVLTVLLQAFPASFAPAVERWDTFSDTWVATDELGRALPAHAETGGPRENRTVGLFYYVWHGPHGYDRTRPMDPDQGVLIPDPKIDVRSPFEIAKILAQPLEQREWGPRARWHHWGQPLFDYYVSNDAWVIRKHAQMLSDAGVDVIIFDATNGLHYRGVYMEICRIFHDIRSKGGSTPAISFNCGTLPQANKKTVPAIYADLYAKGLYRDLWFMWKGKPLILANFTALEDGKYREFFSMRYSWAWSRNRNTGRPTLWFGDGRDRWPWLDTTPQNYGWHESPDKAEQVAVSTAEHPTSDMGKSHHGGKSAYPPSPSEGLHFAEQWERALEVAPEFVFITQWNEWTAQRFINEGEAQFARYAGGTSGEGDSIFIDSFDMEHNRDIEPMRGGYADNYYCQMVGGIRRFKGTRPAPVAGEPVTIAGFAGWDRVRQEFRDDRHDTVHRDHFGWGRIGRLTDTTGRNDIVTAKVAHDQENICFLVTTAGPLAPCAGENWMELFLAVDGLSEETPDWEGYHYRLRLEPMNKKYYAVEKSLGGWHWRGVGRAEIRQEDRRLMLTVPRGLVGLSFQETGDRLSFRFKWSDNRQTDKAIDWLRHGDAAPNARFQYQYRTKAWSGAENGSE